MALMLSGSEGVSVDGTNWAFTPLTTGYVQTLAMPQCHVYRTGGGWTASTTEGVFIFNGVVSHSGVPQNTGNAYNTSTGVFTCPVAGRYRVDVTMLTGNTGYTYLNIRKNGVMQSINAHQSRGATGWSNIGVHTVVFCAANDTLQCNWWTGATASVYTGGDYCQMMITMIG